MPLQFRPRAYWNLAAPRGGGNLIPLALRFPDAQFVGVDLARRHIEDGQRRIAELGLKNIELRQADLTQVSFAGAKFDYVLCHGVFSWVPIAAQDAIFRLCSETLSPEGAAIISYNVLPGLAGSGRVARPFGFALTDPGMPLSRTRLFLKVTRIVVQSFQAMM